MTDRDRAALPHFQPQQPRDRQGPRDRKGVELSSPSSSLPAGHPDRRRLVSDRIGPGSSSLKQLSYSWVREAFGKVTAGACQRGCLWLLEWEYNPRGVQTQDLPACPWQAAPGWALHSFWQIPGSCWFSEVLPQCIRMTKIQLAWTLICVTGLSFSALLYTCGNCSVLCGGDSDLHFPAYAELGSQPYSSVLRSMAEGGSPLCGATFPYMCRTPSSVHIRKSKTPELTFEFISCKGKQHVRTE